MAEYRVIRIFTDRTDREHLYRVGDPYPRIGLEVTDERIAELSGYENRLREPLIEKVEEPKPAKKTRKKKTEG